MDFIRSNFNVYMIYDDNKIKIFNNSNYNCRVHFIHNNEKKSLLCYSKTSRPFDGTYTKLKMYTNIQKNEKILLVLDDLQFYFDDDKMYKQYQRWKYNYENNIIIDDDKNSNTSKSSDEETSLEEFKKGNVDWSSSEDITKKNKKEKKTKEDDNQSNKIEQKQPTAIKNNNENSNPRRWENKQQIDREVGKEQINKEQNIKYGRWESSFLENKYSVTKTDFFNKYDFQSKILDLKNESLKNGYIFEYALIKIDK